MSYKMQRGSFTSLFPIMKTLLVTMIIIFAFLNDDGDDVVDDVDGCLIVQFLLPEK